jgi:hypothetical protein
MNFKNRTQSLSISLGQISNRGTRMKILLAILAIVLLAGMADAQDAGGMGRKGGKGRNSPENAEQQKADQQKKKAVDDAYKSALDRIPDPKSKFDPWRSAR